MGIDIYLKWDGMTDEDKEKQVTGMSTIAGEVGYLREAYHGGPYATKILCREAFESDSCEAEIPADVLRERLTHVTEPVIGANGGHIAAAMFAEIMKLGGASIEGQILSDITSPMTVEEAVRERCQRLYPEDGPEHVEAVVNSFRAFVALAERKEAETGKPCTIYASY
jgi:hypothetical protein